MGKFFSITFLLHFWTNLGTFLNILEWYSLKLQCRMPVTPMPPAFGIVWFFNAGGNAAAATCLVRISRSLCFFRWAKISTSDLSSLKWYLKINVYVLKFSFSNYIELVNFCFFSTLLSTMIFSWLINIKFSKLKSISEFKKKKQVLKICESLNLLLKHANLSLKNSNTGPNFF